VFTAWPIVAFAPSAGLVPLVRGPADTYLYLPLVGLCAALAFLGERAEARGHAIVRPAAFACVLVYGLGGAIQAGVWQSSSALWRRAVALYPAQPSAHQNLGDALLGEGRPVEALPHLERALELLPVALAEPPGMRALADACFSLARHDCAVRWYTELRRRFGSSPGIVLRLLSALALEADPARADQFRSIRSEAIGALRRTRGDPAALHTLFDEHLAGDPIPRTGLAELTRDPEVGAAARTLLRSYGRGDSAPPPDSRAR
jgi:tetratricopeptide (TPR) repeat protein